MSTDYGDTSATTPDPESAAEGDTNQLEQEDTLLDRGVDNLLDEGYSPPDHPPNNHRVETQLEQYEGETLDERLEQEQPEVWESEGPAAGASDPDRAGRLAVAQAEPSGESATSLMATDAGISGGGASAEEAAVHVIDDEDL